MEAAEKAFWDAYLAVGKEVLDEGKRMGFGMSLVEVKFQDGTPSVLIRSIAMTTKHPDNNSAKKAIALQLEEAEKERFDGVRTLSVVYHNGQINRVLLDEYANKVLK